MAINAKFQADFSSFQDAVKNADVQLKTLADDAAKVPAALTRIGNSLSGTKLIQDATLMAAAVEKIGGSSKLTEAELTKVSAKAQEAAEKMRALGVTVPKGIQDLADATTNLSTSLTNAGESAGHFFAEFLSAQAIFELLKESLHLVSEAAQEFFQILVKGAEVAHIEENFKHLTAQAGLLAEELMGSLREGTHNTITDFELMKKVNQDLAAGMRLSQDQFGLLAKGAYALSQTMGISVSEGFDRMNDAMLTGRTKGLGTILNMEELKAATDRYTEAAKRNGQELTDAGKIEATRAAVLETVASTLARVGEQTEGLDVKLQQLKTAWANFEEELGKVIATSDILREAITGLEGIFKDAFGGTQAEMIKNIAHAFDTATIAVVGFGADGIQVAGAIATEFIALEKVLGDVRQLIDLASLGAVKADNLLLRMAAAAAARTGPGSAQATESAKLAAEGAAEEARLSKAIAERGAALQQLDADQKRIGETTATYTAKLKDLSAQLAAAQHAADAFVGPLQDTATAHQQATGVANQHALALTKDDAATKAFAKALQEVTANAAPWYEVLQTIDGAVLEGAKYYLTLGRNVEQVGLIYGLTKGQIEAVADAMKFEQTMVEAAGKSYADLTKHLAELEKQKRTSSDKAFLANLTVEISATKSALDTIDKARLTSYQYDLKLIQDEATARRANLDQMGAGYNDALAAIAADTDVQMNEAAKRWRVHLDEMENATGSFAKTAMGWLQQIPATLRRAFEGGGGFAGAFKSMFAGIGADIGTDAFGKLAGSLSNVFSKTFGTKVTQALGSIIPGIGGVIGSLAGVLFDKIGDLFGGAEKKINPIRQQFIDAAGGLGELNFKAHEAGVTLDHLLNAKNPKQYQAAIDELNNAFKRLDLTTKIKDTQAQINEGFKNLALAGIASSNTAISSLKAELSPLQLVTDNVEKLAVAYRDAQVAGDKSKMAEILKEQAPLLIEQTGLVKQFTAQTKDQLVNLGVVAEATFQAAIAKGASFSEAIAAAGPGLLQLGDAFHLLGIQSSDPLLNILTLQARIAKENPELVAGVSGLGEALVALSGTGMLNVDTFHSVQAAGMHMYEQLQAAVAAHGGATKDALLPMQDYLHDAEEAAKALGVPLDANTQMLIDQSKDLDIWKEKGKSANDLLLDGIKKLVDTMNDFIRQLQGLPPLINGIPSPDITGTVHWNVDPVPGPTGGSDTRSTPGGNVIIDHKNQSDVLTTVPQLAGGTYGRFFDFGRGTLVALHGQERVMTESEGRQDAGMRQPVIIQVLRDGRKETEMLIENILKDEAGIRRVIARVAA